LEDVWALPNATSVLASGLNKGALAPVEETATTSSSEKAKVEAVLI
jgi:hypothetical protein